MRYLECKTKGDLKMNFNYSSKNLEILFIIFLVIVGIYYLFLASNTKFLGDDEFGYYYNGKIFSEGKFPNFDVFNISTSFPGIFISLIYAFFFLIFGPSLAIAKMISVFFGFLTLLVIYLIGKKISIFYGIISSIIILSISIFTNFMFLAYVDVPITFFSALIFYLILELDSYKKSIFTGIVLGISYLVKSSAFIIALFLLSISIFKFLKEKNRQQLKFTLIILFISAIILSSYVIRGLILFKYPNYDVLNLFFKNPLPTGLPKWLEGLISTISPVRLDLSLFTSTIGWILVALSIFGFSWLSNYSILDKKQKELLLNLFFFISIFLIVFSVTQISGAIALESRHMFIMFPQLALTAGFFLWKLKEKNKWLGMIIIIPILLFSLYISVLTAQQTASSQRFPDDHIKALNWIKDNTPKDAFIFTTYGGPLQYYSGRWKVWATSSCLGEDFPNLMTTTNGTYIAETLKDKCNVSYILIWSNTVAQNYIIPGSNLWGVYTYNFVNVVSNDKKDFNITFSNQNNLVLKIL
jgi:hypothetical protein